jgi:hypothetical protein
MKLTDYLPKEAYEITTIPPRWDLSPIGSRRHEEVRDRMIGELEGVVKTLRGISIIQRKILDVSAYSPYKFDPKFPELQGVSLKDYEEELKWWGGFGDFRGWQMIQKRRKAVQLDNLGHNEANAYLGFYLRGARGWEEHPIHIKRVLDRVKITWRSDLHASCGFINETFRAGDQIEIFGRRK